MLRIFKPIEGEVKTKRTKDDVIKSLLTRAYFESDTFRINARTFSLYRGSKVVGSVKRENEVTIVSFKIHPSADFKAGISLFLFIGTIIPLVLLTNTIIHQELDIRTTNIIAFSILGLLAFWIVALLIFNGMFKMSGYLQKESIRALTLNGN